MKKPRHWLYTAVLLTAVFFCLLSTGTALWTPVKAELAQWLILQSWGASGPAGTPAPPWPWADTRPAAMLVVPAHGVRQVVLEGNSGRNLAFGPVFVDGTSSSRDMIISGHRDTHFRFLAALKQGDMLLVQSRLAARWFEVEQAEVVDSRYLEMLIEPGLDRVSLVTCYPFDSPVAGGPLRYVVTARPVKRRSLSSG